MRREAEVYLSASMFTIQFLCSDCLPLPFACLQISNKHLHDKVSDQRRNRAVALRNMSRRGKRRSV